MRQTERRKKRRRWVVTWLTFEGPGAVGIAGAAGRGVAHAGEVFQVDPDEVNRDVLRAGDSSHLSY